GDELLVDGNSGVVFVNPPPDVVREYDRLDREYRAFNRELGPLRGLPAETTDGRRVNLYANIGLIGDLVFVHRHGADGIGLYRTEFPFLTYRDFPDEEEQVQLYARAVRGMEGKPVTIRTLDIGADKYPPYLNLAREENPFLGWRSIRISLEMPELFRTQIRAILRVGTLGRVRLLLPMISGLEEIRRAKELIEEAKEELRREGQDFDPSVPMGIMVEVPSAVALASHLLPERPDRPDPAPARRRPQQRARGDALRAAASCRAAGHPRDRASREGCRKMGGHVRRDGVGSAVHHRAPRARPRRPLHGAVLHP